VDDAKIFAGGVLSKGVVMDVVQIDKNTEIAEWKNIVWTIGGADHKQNVYQLADRSITRIVEVQRVSDIPCKQVVQGLCEQIFHLGNPAISQQLTNEQRVLLKFCAEKLIDITTVR